MTDAELIKAAAYLMERIGDRATPANDIIGDYVRTHRYLTAEERAKLLDMVWTAIRATARLKYAYPECSWAERLQHLSHTGVSDCADAPNWVRWEVPEWFPAHVPEAELELPQMLGNAPIILRANGNRDKVIAALAEEGVAVEPCAQSPFGLILPKFQDLTGTKVYKKGLLEIQDEGAQLVALDIGVKPKQDVFDFCAGVGGKSLIFAQMMENRGLIQAYDIMPKRLFELTKRAARAHVSIIKIVPKLPEPHKKFDHVVVDAPCSGTGTWRRMPDMRWKFSEKQLANIIKTQAEILNRAERYVKNGHYLSYITCSLTQDENEAQVAAFLKTHPNYTVLKQKRYSPWRTKTDGFFLCLMQKR